MIESMTDPQIERLAAAPFLLMSLRERDHEYWHVLFANDPNLDLLFTVDTYSDMSQLAPRIVLEGVSGRQPRLAASEEFWSKMLGAGLNAELDVRHAAHLAALQSILTEDPTARYRAVQAAACRTRIPSLSVADKNERS